MRQRARAGVLSGHGLQRHRQVTSATLNVSHPHSGMKSALLVIDVQKALCSGEGAAFDIEAIIERINRVSGAARAIGAPVVLVQHEDEDSLGFGTEGWQLDERLAVRPEDHR